MTLHDDARSYLSRWSGVDMHATPDQHLPAIMSATYAGGWDAFVNDYKSSEQRLMRVFSQTGTVAPSVTAQFTAMRKLVGGTKADFHLPGYDSVHTVSMTDTKAVALIRRTRVDERARRDHITGYGWKIMQYVREDTDSAWVRVAPIQSWDDDNTNTVELVRFGGISTPDRVADQRDQYESCYRPGTESHPMAGWAARLEVSHEQAHANETFQSPYKSKG